MDQDQLLDLAVRSAKGVIGGQITEAALGSLLEPLAKRWPILNMIPLLRGRNFERLIREIARNLDVVKHDMERVSGEGFAHFASRVFEKGAREHREMKTKMLASVLVYGVSKPCRDEFDVQIDFLETVDWMQPWHVAILRYLRKEHSEDLPDGAVRVSATATFEGFSEQNLGLPATHKNEWLIHALLGLWDHNLIRAIDGGAQYTRSRPPNRGSMNYDTDRASILKHSKIGLRQLSVDVLRYLEFAWQDEQSDVAC